MANKLDTKCHLYTINKSIFMNIKALKSSLGFLNIRGHIGNVFARQECCLGDSKVVFVISSRVRITGIENYRGKFYLTYITMI